MPINIPITISDNSMYKSLFILVVVASLILFYLGAGKNRRIWMFLVPWVLVTGLLADNGFFLNLDTQPPRFAFILIGAVLLCFLLFHFLKQSNVNPGFLLAVHLLRIPVEIVIYQQYVEGNVPVYMTFAGWNFDIVVGISALLIFYYRFISGKFPRKEFMLLWNIAGILFLGFIVTIAVLSSPLPLQVLAFDQPNVMVLMFPYVWLPAIVVPLVLMSHILMIRRIIQDAVV